MPPRRGRRVHILKLWSLMSKFHRLIRRSSAEMNVSPSVFSEMELMWYAWALAYTRRGTCAYTLLWFCSLGRRSCETLVTGSGLLMLDMVTTLSCFSYTFQSLIVLSVVGPAAARTTPFRAPLCWRARTRSATTEPCVRTVGRQQKVRAVLTLAPLDLVDLFLNLDALEVVKLGLMALELGPELVLASSFLWRAPPPHGPLPAGHAAKAARCVSTGCRASPPPAVAPPARHAPPRPARRAPHGRRDRPWPGTGPCRQTRPLR